MKISALLSAAWVLASSASFALAAVPPTYDFIVIGGGNAGSPCAANLVKNGYSVLLVEEGPDWDPTNLDNIAPRVPFNNWKNVKTTNRVTAEADIFGNRKEILYGRGMGGTTNINAGLYTRPADADFDNWGIPFWDSSNVNPVFHEMENIVDSNTPGVGTSGPLRVQAPLTQQSHIADFLSAIGGFGFTEADGMAGTTAAGIMFENKLIRTEQGFRLNAYSAFILPLILAGNSDLTVKTDTRAIKILYRQGATNEAYGVKLVTGGSKPWMALARYEVIISAGVFETPKLLHLSGIGGIAELADIGIAQRVDLPMVGQNLIARPLTIVAVSGVTLLPEQNPAFEGDLNAINDFLTGAGGYYATPIDAAIAYGTDVPSAIPSFMMQVSTVQPPFESPIPTAMSFPCLNAHPLSRGSVKARSNNPSDKPSITTGMLTNPADFAPAFACVTLGREVAASIPAITGTEFLPGASISSTNDVMQYISTTHRFSYHAFGSCRIGTDENDSVVDDHLKVHKFSNLRIVDGSVFPSSISSGPMGTTYMIGYRAGNFIADSPTPIDPNNGFDVCESNSFYIIRDPIASSDITDACNSIGKVPFFTSNPSLTCTAQNAVDALNSCGVSEAFIRPRGFLCDALTNGSLLEKDVNCGADRPVICINGLI